MPWGIKLMQAFTQHGCSNDEHSFSVNVGCTYWLLGYWIYALGMAPRLLTMLGMVLGMVSINVTHHISGQSW